MSAMVGRVPAADYAAAERMGEVVAARWYGRNCKRLPASWDRDDAMAAARLGVYVAATRFEPERGLEFTTVAYHYALGYARQDVRALVDVPGHVRHNGSWLAQDLAASLDRRAPGMPERFADLLVDRRPPPDRDLWRVVELLEARTALVLRLRHQEKLSYKQIGKRLGCAPNTARDVELRGLRRLRELLDDAPPPPPPPVDPELARLPKGVSLATVERVGAALDALGVDLHYCVEREPREAAAARLGLRPKSMFAMITAVRQWRGIQMHSRGKGGQP